MSLARQPANHVKKIDTDISLILRTFDQDDLAKKQKELLAALRQDLVDARIYASAYELSETEEEARANAKQARKWLGRARKHILEASEFNAFGPVDVAQLSANIEQIIEELV